MERRRVKKVLLINPPGVVYLFPDGRPAHRKHCTPPLGLGYLAANLLRAGYEVEVIDILAEGYSFEELRDEQWVVYGLPLDEVLERVQRSKSDLIGMSVLFSSSASEALRICKVLKGELTDIPIVLGGHNPTGAPYEVMKDQNIDYVLLGEAELSFIALLEALNGRIPIEEVRGLVYRDGENIRSTMTGKKTVYAGKGYDYYLAKDLGVPMNLDELPRPAWHLFPMDAYWNVDVRISGGDAATDRYGVMVSSRGCPHVCYYCTSPLQSGYKGYRRRSNESVIEEIRWLVDELSVKEVMFFDDNFFVSVPRAKELLRRIAREFRDVLFSVPGGTEVNAIDEEMIDLLAAANFYKLLLNIESGNQELQEALIDKKVKLHRVPTLFNCLRSKGIETRAALMIGFPGEKRESIERTIALAKSLNADDFFLSIVAPLPGTPLWDECIEKGLFVEGTTLNNICFSHSTIKLPDTTPEELENLRYTSWKEGFEDRRSRVLGQRHKKFQNRHDYETTGFKFLQDKAALEGNNEFFPRF